MIDIYWITILRLRRVSMRWFWSVAGLCCCVIDISGITILAYSMSVRTQIYYPNGIYFITFTCARWLPLFQITNGYSAVYKWFDYLKDQGHYIIGYVIMPNHIHAIIGFGNASKSINSIVGNGKRFMAYELIKLLKEQKQNDLLHQLEQMTLTKSVTKNMKCLNLHLIGRNAEQ